MNWALDPTKVAAAVAQSRRGLTVEKVQQIAEMYARRHTTTSIGEHFHVDPGTVHRVLLILDVPMRQAGQQTVWTNEFTSAVKALRASGLSWDKVAQRAGISRTTLANARRRGVL